MKSFHEQFDDVVKSNPARNGVNEYTQMLYDLCERFYRLGWQARGEYDSNNPRDSSVSEAIAILMGKVQ